MNNIQNKVLHNEQRNISMECYQQLPHDCTSLGHVNDETDDRQVASTIRYCNWLRTVWSERNVMNKITLATVMALHEN